MLKEIRVFLRYVVFPIFTDISEEFVAFIFKVEELHFLNYRTLLLMTVVLRLLLLLLLLLLLK
jgi:hypothetical protein